MLKPRLITATILAAFFASTLVFLSPFVFAQIMIFVVLVAGWEWTDLAAFKTRFSKYGFLLTLGTCLVVTGYYVGFHTQLDVSSSYNICALVVAFWAIIFLWLQGYPTSSILWSPKPVMALIGLILLVSTWLAIVTILMMDNGKWLLGLAITTVVLADVGGYVVGKLFGRHKLAPTISPGKTWQGLMGGLLFQLLLIAALKISLPETDLFKLALLIIPVGLISVVGDLFESMIKRQRGVKDSSALLPGHGGVLDRLDGVMAAMPLFLVILYMANPF
ncbi:phosphatidate cytidylyltransferase [Porticoccaceae bacterium]|nr:phosphatidate cytidylyltransferase [Porticoccaceae bacterium]